MTDPAFMDTGDIALVSPSQQQEADVGQGANALDDEYGYDADIEFAAMMEAYRDPGVVREITEGDD